MKLLTVAVTIVLVAFSFITTPAIFSPKLPFSSLTTFYSPMVKPVYGQEPPSSICPQNGTVQHWDKIVFRIDQDRSQQIPADYINTTLDLKLIDPPMTIVNLENEIFNHLEEQFELQEIERSDIVLEILDIKYETVNCLLMVPEVAPGQRVSHTTLRTTHTGFIDNPQPGHVVLEQQFVLSDTASVFSSANIFANTAEAVQIQIIVDGVTQTLVGNRESAEQSFTTSLTPSWAGDLGPGEHTIQVSVGSSPGLFRLCAVSSTACTLNTLIIE